MDGGSSTTTPRGTVTAALYRRIGFAAPVFCR